MPCDLIDLALPGVRLLRPYQPGKPVADLERELGITGAVKLASNENPLGPGAAALEAIAANSADLARYPDGNGTALRHALAERLNVDPQCLTLGNGSNDVLELAARAFAGPGDEVIFAAHSFAVYPIVTQAVGATAVVTPVRQWVSDLTAMRDAVTDRTRLIFIANPNNPTGTLVDSAALKTFVEALPEHVLIILDQAYFEYVDAPGYADCTTWVADHDRIIVTRTFSKIHGLAGLRIGYGVSSPAIADLLNRVRQPFNVNSLALAAALAALDDAEHVARSVALNRSGLDLLMQAAAKLGLETIPSAGNFLCINMGRPADAVYDALLKQGVIVRPVANYGMPDWLRITVGLAEENQRFIVALEQALAV